MVKHIESLNTQQDRCAFRCAYPILNKERYVLRRCPTERRFADHAAVDHRSVVRRAVTVVVDTCRRVERTSSGKLYKGSGSKVPRKTVAAEEDRTVPLVDHTWPTFKVAQSRERTLI